MGLPQDTRLLLEGEQTKACFPAKSSCQAHTAKLEHWEQAELCCEALGKGGLLVSFNLNSKHWED